MGVDESVATGSKANAFEASRAVLFGVAYRVTGSVADAEDVVQDAWLRWSEVEQGSIMEPRAFLVTVATRLAIDRLRRRKSRNESHSGNWLPEPLLGAIDPAERAEVAESVSVGLLVVLETLSPLERAVFVLREAFAYDYATIARIVGRQEATVRQLAHRARRSVVDRRPRYIADAATHKLVTERFLAATSSGDIGALMQILAPEVVLLADGGGKVRAPLLPVIGAEKVVRFLAAVIDRSGSAARAEIVGMNGTAGVRVSIDGEPVAAISLEVGDARIRVIHLLADPDKLRPLASPGPVRVDRTPPA